MSPLQLNSLVEKQGNCAMDQGKYTWLGNAHPGIFTQLLPSSTSFPICPLSQPALRSWDSLDNVSIPKVA